MELLSSTELVRRIERLERQGRRLRWAVLACTVLLAASLVACAGRKDEVPKVIRAGTFLVLNDAGREVIRISSSTEEGGQEIGRAHV